MEKTYKKEVPFNKTKLLRNLRYTLKILYSLFLIFLLVLIFIPITSDFIFDLLYWMPTWLFPILFLIFTLVYIQFFENINTEIIGPFSKIITKIKMTEEIKETLRILDEISDEIDKIDEEGSLIPWYTIKSSIIKFIHNNKKEITKGIRENKIVPRIFLLNFICDYTRPRLTSGHYHIYRGVLSLQGHGLYKLFVFTLTSYVSLGLLTNDEIKDTLKEVSEEIKMMG